MLYVNYSQLCWWLVRLTALLLVPGVFYDLEILVMICSLIIIHVKLGLEAILNDYVHDKVVCLCFLFLVRLSSLEIVYFFSDFLL
uniref:succinate dehydrogenase subunit 4 n=1 Tax=Batrachospermum sp. TaxID=31373 RepID=UPI001FA727C4|nr:succinate dehydrogenase subunit 4 [Batrachospermum sp.]UNB13399.1 succinate dehydrogenase subunit 4 [Batrachospermum sp.]